MAETTPPAGGKTAPAQKAAETPAAPPATPPVTTAPATPPAAPATPPAVVEPEPAKPATKSKGYVVTGAAVVLPTEGGSERYLYKGAPVGDGYTKEGIKHALAVGLIAKAK